MTVGELTTRLCEWLERLFPDHDRGERLQAALRERFGGDERTVTGELCRELEAVAHGFARHLELEYVPEGGLVADADPPGWPPPDVAEIRARAGSVGEVRRVDGVGVLALDGLDDVRHAGPYVQAAFELLRGARGLVLDLRRNGGGDPGTVMLVLEWLLGGAVAHIADVQYRDRTRQWWTTGRIAGRALPPEVPVAVLIGERTYSSGEALAYHVQARGRARLFGGRTPGAADHVTPVRLGTHVRAVVPEARVRDTVTGGNWEGTGVIPDVACEPDDALAAALEHVRATCRAPGGGGGARRPDAPLPRSDPGAGAGHAVPPEHLLPRSAGALGQGARFRPLTRADLPLLKAWLEEPLVRRWWNHETSEAALERDFGPSLDGDDPAEFFVALDGDHPFGLIQRYEIEAYPEYVEELAPLLQLPLGALSVDYLIGDPTRRGRGLGAAMIAAFVAESWVAYPDAMEVIVPVAAGNVASWRALERAGFARVAEGELEPDNPVDPPDHVVYAIRRP